MESAQITRFQAVHAVILHSCFCRVSVCRGRMQNAHGMDASTETEFQGPIRAQLPAGPIRGVKALWASHLLLLRVFPPCRLISSGGVWMAPKKGMTAICDFHLEMSEPGKLGALHEIYHSCGLFAFTPSLESGQRAQRMCKFPSLCQSTLPVGQLLYLPSSFTIKVVGESVKLQFADIYHWGNEYEHDESC